MQGLHHSMGNRLALTAVAVMLAVSLLGSVPSAEAQQDPPFIAGRVWLDTNADSEEGLVADEPGIASILVQLLDANDIAGAPVASMLTLDWGYRFDDVEPGTYVIHFGVPSSQLMARKQASNNPALDSDADIFTRMTDPFVVGVDPVLHMDAGVFPATKTRTSVRVWNDVDGDGIQEPGEPGLPGFDLASEPTDAFGELPFAYVTTLFTTADDGVGVVDLNAGPEWFNRVSLLLPDEFVASPAMVGPPETDSDATPRANNPFVVSAPHLPADPSSHHQDIGFGLVLRPLGDVDCNNEVSIVDALMMAQHAVGQRAAQACRFHAGAQSVLSTSRGDTNNDGAVNVLDALMVAQCVALISNALCPNP